jgi:hypothetical protein
VTVEMDGVCSRHGSVRYSFYVVVGEPELQVTLGRLCQRILVKWVLSKSRCVLCSTHSVQMTVGML